MKKTAAQPKTSEKKNDGSTITGMILIGVGCIFLLDNFLPGFDIGKLWPLFPIVIGISLIAKK